MLFYKNNAKEIQKLKDEIERINIKIKSLENDSSVDVDIEQMNVGDVLPDGSIIVIKDTTCVIVMAPEYTEVMEPWNYGCFERAYAKMDEFGFECCQWYVPSINLLKIAFNTIECYSHFNEGCYWSSDTDPNDKKFVLGMRDGIFRTRTSKDSDHKQAVRFFKTIVF